MPSILSRSDRDAVATLTMERPQARNALSLELMNALIGALDAISKDRSVKAVILRGAGPAFCAGHDLKEMRANPGRAFMQQTFETCSRLMLAITRLRQPVIAEVHGIATAAGCQLVATCDLALCADDARFATPGVNIGLFCSTPMVALIRAVPRKAAMKMLLTGDMIDAAEAVRIGLVNGAVPSANLHEAATALAAQIAAKSGPVLAIGKEAFSRQIDMTLAEAYTYAGSVMTENMMLRDAAEGIDAFLEKRKPTWCD
ncbi:MAG: enoyl-CoA hydratase [Rhodospirillaceae bacterium]